MKIERTKNASRNMFFGIIQKIYTIAVPFLMRTAMIYFMGVQYLGLNSLFTTILSVLNLAELGVGSAMVFSMYKPIAEDDSEKICALMRLYKIYYRVIGLVIAVLGIALIPFLPNLIKSDVPQGINIYILYLLNLGTTVFTYWLFAYKNCLLGAHQRNDVGTKIGMIISTLTYILQFLCLWLLRDYYIYLIIAFATGILSNIVTAIVTTKMYPDYKAKGELPKEERKQINKRVRDLFATKVGMVIVNSADTLVISAFLGLAVLAVYQNYYFILSSIIGIITIVFSSCTAGIGNSLITETKEKNLNDLKIFLFILCWISGFCACCFLNLFQPFMQIWVGDSLMLSYEYVVCFAVYFVIVEINSLLNLYKDAGGLWHKDKFRVFATAFANLALNLIFVNFWGLFAILLSTVVSMLFVGMPWLLHNLFTVLFNHKELKGFLKKLLLYIVVICVSCVVCTLVCSLINLSGWLTIIIRLLICCIIPNLIFFVVFFKTKEFRGALNIIDRMTKNKLRLTQRILRS